MPITPDFLEILREHLEFAHAHIRSIESDLDRALQDIEVLLGPDYQPPAPALQIDYSDVPELPPIVGGAHQS